MKKTLSVICALMMCFAVVGCGNTESNTNNNQTEAAASAAPEEKELTPIEALTSDEKEVFDIVVNADFYNKSEARVMEAIKTVSWNIAIKGTNKAGGTLNKWFYEENGKLIQAGDYNLEVRYDIVYSRDTRDFSEWADDVELSDQNISNINKALEYYWNELGL
ncbi:MAG: hypothetical protein IJ746_07915 [Ruminococcus sp.]|nr:hypothetical protein [Ruminococcus sp.]